MTSPTESPSMAKASFDENVEAFGTSELSGDKDEKYLARIGKKQQLTRRFGFTSTIAFSFIILATWEGTSGALRAGLLNGGPSALVFGFIVVFIGTLALSASLAEMASISPVAGAQYHWAAQFSPASTSSFTSWIQGWITVLGWQAIIAGITFLTATQIQGLVVLNYPDYVFHRWHGTLLMWAVIALAFFLNVYGIRLLPLIQTISGICHVLFFLGLLIPLLVLAPKSSASFVFTDVESNGGWSSTGISWCVGLLTAAFGLSGFDGVVHMSEEVDNAAVTVPRCMILSILINGVLGFAFLIACLFSIGNIENVVNTPTGFPIIEIFYQATGSIRSATLMMTAIVLISFFTTFGILASGSRLTWAFARDNGLPFSKFFSHIHPRHNVPVRTISLAVAITVLLSLINIGSTTAFNALLSLATIAINISYIIPIGVLTIKRIRRQPIRFGPFTLGRFGLPINIFAFIWGVFLCIFLLFPPELPVNANNMNYSGPVFGFVLLFSVVWYVHGRKHFTGPIKELSQEEAD